MFNCTLHYDAEDVRRSLQSLGPAAARDEAYVAEAASLFADIIETPGVWRVSHLDDGRIRIEREETG